MKYKVGDKVRVRSDLVGGKTYYMDDKSFGDTAVSTMRELGGKIVTIVHADKKYAIKDSVFNWVDEMFEPVNTQKIVITTDGNETLARLYDGKKVVKTATAKCSPDDTFDFETGAKLAFSKLMNNHDIGEAMRKFAEAVKKIKIPTLSFEIKPKYYNGKVVCVKSDGDFTVGKVYEFVDGQVKDDDGSNRPIGNKVKKLEDYNGLLYGFIPFVE